METNTIKWRQVLIFFIIALFSIECCYRSNVAVTISQVSSSVKPSIPLTEQDCEGSESQLNALTKCVKNSLTSVAVYILCGEKDFTFNNFLSMKSIIRFIQPEMIIVAKTNKTVNDKKKHMYNTWLRDIEAIYPFLLKKNITRDFCSPNHTKIKSSIVNYLNQFSNGAMFVGERTVFMNSPHAILSKENVTDSLNENLDVGFYFIPHSMQNQTWRSEDKDTAFKDLCADVSYNITDQLLKACYTFEDSHPKDFYRLETPLAFSVRQLLYGDGAVMYPKKAADPVVPNIGHIIWIGGAAPDVEMFLAILGALFVAQLDHVYIHGDKPLHGKYWNITQTYFADRVHFMYKPRQFSIFDQKVKDVHHQADLLKVDIMVRYGGIIFDPDMLFLQQIAPDLYHYDFVISPDMTPGEEYPDIFNMGIVLSKPGSEFAKLWQQSQKDFWDEGWLWNSGCIPYKIWERNPSIAYVSRELQVICPNWKCYPTWMPRGFYNNETLKMSNSEIEAMRHKAMMLHIVWPPAFSALKEVIYESKGIYGESGRMILRKAGVIGEQTGLVP